MLNKRASLVAGLWLTAVAAIMAWSVAVEASVSTSAFLFVATMAPLGLALLLGWGAPPPTVAEVLHAVDSRKDRR